LRRPNQSLITPENTFSSSAVASARPSSRPTSATLMPSASTMNSGSSAWIISDETSISRLTRPSAQMAVGRRAVEGEGWTWRAPEAMAPHSHPVITGAPAAAQ
jgi:hypothetical protein